MTTDELHKVLKQYREVSAKLKEYRSSVFPVGDAIKVNCSGRYAGPSKVAFDPDCPMDQLPCLNPNGNVWWYPLEDCRLS